MRPVLLSSLLVLAACSSSNTEPTGTPTVTKITDASALIGGPDAAGRVGDFLLDNGKVRFLIQAPGAATGWGLYGGSLMDLDRSGGPGDDRLQEIFFQCDLRGFAPETAEIVADGRDGKPGVLRMKGTDKGIPLLDAIIPSQPSQLAVTIDLTLPPASATLQIGFDVVDERRDDRRDIGCGVVLLHGDSYDFFTPGNGPTVSDSNAWIASSAPGVRASYVLFHPTEELKAIVAVDEVVPLSGAVQTVFPGGRARDSLYVTVGERDVESALGEVRALRGDTAARVSVEVPVTAAAPRLAITTVVIRDRGAPPSANFVTLSAPDPTTGVARAALVPGAYTAEVGIEGRVVRAVDFDVAAGAAPTLAPVTIDDEGTLVIDAAVTDAAGGAPQPSAAHLFVKRGAAAAPGAANVLKRYVRASDEVVLPVGEYTVFLSRGPECELHSETVTVRAGERTEVRARMARVVDTTGWVTVDTHVHSTKSVDSNESLEQRVLGAVGEGLEILLSTDHDVVIDYAPTVAALGLTGQVATERGTEISPLYGHINAWPLPAQSPEKYWDLKWFVYEGEVFQRMLDPHEIVTMARGKGASVVQINHPRDSKGVFDYIGLDPDTGNSRKPWPGSDVVELINGKGEGGLPAVLRDLSWQWKKDVRVTAVGVSDAHGRGSEIGYARTAIHSASDDPASLDLPAVWAALRQGRAVVMSGPFVTLRARAGAATTGVGVGEVLASGGQPVKLDVVVQAPSWMDVSRVRLMADGATMWERQIGVADRDPQNGVVRLRTTVTATPTRDAFYLVVADGEGRNEPVMGSTSHSATNPVFVDVAGDGYAWGR